MAGTNEETGQEHDGICLRAGAISRKRMPFDLCNATDTFQ